MTVEELREVAINVMRNMDVPSYPELVDDLIAAAKEEGAEQMRAIVMAKGKLCPRMSAIFPVIETTLGIVSPENPVWIIDASVLAPKEKS